jgi:pyruvate,water dikinase
MTMGLAENELMEEGIEPSRFPVLWATQTGEIGTPFAFSCANYWEIGALRAGEEMSLPPTRGLTVVTKTGLSYFCGVPVKDKEEISRREERFKKFMLKVMMDPVKYWAGYKKEMQVNLDYLKAYKLQQATNLELVVHMEKTWQIAERHHVIHFLVMYPFLAAYMMFEQMCQEMFGINEKDPSFITLMKGFDSRVFQIDRRLWELARKAKEFGLASVFQKAEGKELLTELEKNDKGKIWCQEFRSFLQKDGFRNETFSDPSWPSWIEDPTVPLYHIKGFLDQTDNFNLDQIRQRQINERRKAEKQFLSKVPRGKEKMSFMDMLGALIFSLRYKTLIKSKKALELAAFMGTAQQFGVFNEEHNLYIEQASIVAMRMVAQEVGKRLVKAGALDNPEDAFYLRFSELRRYLLKAEWLDCRPLVAKRRAEYKPVGPPYIGDPSAVEMDLALAKIVGVAARGISEAGVGADLSGIPACPGVVEGHARVIYDRNELGTIQLGEILVADTTWATWTPVFSRIKAVVTNIGGTLSHSAIVAREYNIPAVLSTGDATKRIKTGQLLRVDGTDGKVYILDKK